MIEGTADFDLIKCPCKGQKGLPMGLARPGGQYGKCTMCEEEVIVQCGENGMGAISERNGPLD